MARRATAKRLTLARVNVYTRPTALFGPSRADALEADVAALLDADVVVIPPEGDEIAEIVAAVTGARVVYS